MASGKGAFDGAWGQGTGGMRWGTGGVGRRGREGVTQGGPEGDRRGPEGTGGRPEGTGGRPEEDGRGTGGGTERAGGDGKGTGGGTEGNRRGPQRVVLRAPEGPSFDVQDDVVGPNGVVFRAPEVFRASYGSQECEFEGSRGSRLQCLGRLR